MRPFPIHLLIILVCLGLALPTPGRCAEELDTAKGEILFGRVEAMLADLSSIFGFGAEQPISRQLLTRQEIGELVQTRLEEEIADEEIRVEEMYLRLFGFVPLGFDLAEQVADVLTEQATALYDYKTKSLYLATWTPDDMQEFALVHELAHAIADQRFDLGRFVKKSRTADSDLARSAVIEGQASWVMTEWLFQQTGRSLLDDRSLAAATAGASRYEASNYPVYSAAPLYIRETMLFPYTDGLMFQQAVLEKYGRRGFEMVFNTPPLTTRHVLTPESYLSDELPTKPRLLPLRQKGYERTTRGIIGQLEHRILVEQYRGTREEADSMSRQWQGGRFEIHENSARDQAILRYGSDWANPFAARKIFELYREVCLKKLPGAEIVLDEKDRFVGKSDWGWFDVQQIDESVVSLEGLPESPAGVESKLAQLPSAR